MTQQPESGNPQPDDSNPRMTGSPSSPGQQQAGPTPPVTQASGAQPGFMPPPPPKSGPGEQQSSSGLNDMIKKLDPILAKTKIDLEACRRVVKQLMGNKEVELQEKRRAPGHFELPKETMPAERCKTAAVCGASWDNMSGTDRLRLCAQCKSFVYDLSGMELIEAEKLVFQRENKECPFFFKRRDGRYLSQDCPIGVAQAKKRVTLIACAALAIFGVLVLLFLLPQIMPAPQASKNIEASEKAVGAGTEDSSPDSSSAEGTEPAVKSGAGGAVGTDNISPDAGGQPLQTGIQPGQFVGQPDQPGESTNQGFAPEGSDAAPQSQWQSSPTSTPSPEPVPTAPQQPLTGPQDTQAGSQSAPNSEQSSEPNAGPDAGQPQEAPGPSQRPGIWEAPRSSGQSR